VRAMVLPSMKPTFFGTLIAALLVCGFLAPRVFAQAPVGNTTLGKSQNTSEDLANSLIPGPKRFDKGEKKSEVDPKTLQSKTVKDPTFSGSLNDIGLDWSGAAMGKPHGSSDTESKTAQHSDSAAEKDSKASKSRETSAGDAQSKEQKSASSKPEKQPEKQPEKEKASETGGSH